MTAEKEIHHIDREKIFTGPVTAVCDHHLIAFCKAPYYKHQNGCPNWGYKKGCPPHVDFFPNVYSPEVRLAAIRFDFESYLFSKKLAHPDWTDRALRNPRHWQNHLRSQLRSFLFDILSNDPSIIGEIVFNPEAMGVNIFATCENAGLFLERYPEKYVYQVALIAQRLNNS